MGEYAELEIRILKREGEGDSLSFPVEMTLNGAQQLARGRLDPYSYPEPSGVDPDADGEKLLRWLLADPTLYAAWAEVRGQNPSRSVRLRIDAAEPKLHIVPWELLRDPGGQGKEPQPIGTHVATPFSRYLAGPARPGSAIDERPIRLLVAIANPADAEAYGLDVLDEEAEWEALCSTASELPIELSRVQPPVTLGAIEAALRRENPHVFHLIAHGSYSSESERTVLFLVDEHGKANLVPDGLFVSMIASRLGDGSNPLRLLYLGSCQTAVTSPSNAFRGLGQRLIAAGVPAVFAMQDLVPIATNRDFSATFYSRLLAHGLVDLAANEARATLVTGRRPGFAIPVLFSRLPGNRLLAFRRGELAGPGDAPFKGLLVFQEEDADLFFGREALTARLFQHVRDHRFLAVVGASGSGKSSLVRAGLLPQVRSHLKWPIRVLTPTAHPLEALASSLLPDDAAVTAKRTLMNDMAEDSGALHRAVQELVADSAVRPTLLLVVDQFEELFTLCHDETERQAFVDNLVAAVTTETDGPTRVVLTIRGDFYNHCLAYPQLHALLEEKQKIVGAMTAAEMREAIERPVEPLGLVFESGLVDLLLRDVGAADGQLPEPGALPLLSHALLETWRRRERNVLTLAGYTGAGGVTGAIARTADATYASLSASQQAIARNIFLRLTELGEGTQDTRRRAALAELIPQGEDGETMSVVLKTLADARLVTTDEDAAEVAHEALLRHWPELRGWLEDNREGLRLHRKLTDDAAAWEASGHDVSYLYTGARLEAAREWSHETVTPLTSLEQEFLGASIAQREAEIAAREAAHQHELEQAQLLAEEAEARTRAETQRAKDQEVAAQKLRRRAYWLGGLLLLSTLLSVLGFWLYRTAQEQARIALARQLASQSLVLQEKQLDSALLIAAEAVDLLDTWNTRSSLLAALQTNPRLTMYLHGHRDYVTSLAYSPDGTMLASASGNNDSTIVLWDVPSGQQYGEALTGHNSYVNSLVFSPDGRTLASGSDDGKVILWDVASRRPVGEPLADHNDGVSVVAFSPDGAILATGSGEGTIILWDVATGLAIGEPDIGNGDRLQSMVFSPDGTTLSASDFSRTMTVWEVDTGRQLSKLFAGEDDFVYSSAISPDGSTAAFSSGSPDGSFTLWDVATGKQLGEPLVGHSNWVTDLSFSPDGAMLSSASEDGSIILWDVASGTQIDEPLVGHGEPVGLVVFNPQDPFKLASGSLGGTIILWDLNSLHPLGDPLHYVSGSTGIAFSPDGLTLASGYHDGTIGILDVATGRPLGEPLARHNDLVWTVAFSPDSAILASGSRDGAVILWDVARREPIGDPLVGHLDDSVNSLAFSPDGTTLATVGDDGTVNLWDMDAMDTHRLLHELRTTQYEQVTSVAFSAHGQLLASGGVSSGEDGFINLWDLAAPKPVKESLVSRGGGVSSMAFGPEGTILASGNLDGTISIWDIPGRQTIGVPLVGHSNGVSKVAFSPDGSILASASWDGTIILWDLGTKQQLGEPLVGIGPVFDIAFSTDGEILASSHPDYTVIFWDVSVSRWQELACARANRTLTPEELNLHFGEAPGGQTLPGCAFSPSS